MPCPYCGDSHSAFDPCPESVDALLRQDKPKPDVPEVEA